jgi:hypothetical protein
MKPIHIFAVVFVVLGSGCQTKSFSLTDEQAIGLLMGSWSTSTETKISEEDVTVVTTRRGTVTFSEDLTFVSGYDSEAIFTYSEGSSALRYRALVSGTWRIEEGHIIFRRLDEDITPLDELTEAVLKDERVDQIRADAPEETRLNLLSLTENRFQAQEVGVDGHLKGKRIKDLTNRGMERREAAPPKELP